MSTWFIIDPLELESDTTPAKSSRISHKSKSTIRQIQFKDESSSEETLSEGFSFIYAFFVIVLIGISVAVLKVQITQEKEEVISGKGEAFKRFSRDLDRIKSHFPKQNPKIWSGISGSFRRNVYGKSYQPLCFLFLYNETVQKTSDCLGKKL